ncbi:unnamed protein product [Leptosia nina]|uniref:Uncharacterized protein n=1 Tax=Leptosia nina TaxID=320188 RepID=A0AAV1JN22_9NEOP
MLYHNMDRRGTSHFACHLSAAASELTLSWPRGPAFSRQEHASSRGTAVVFGEGRRKGEPINIEETETSDLSVDSPSRARTWGPVSRMHSDLRETMGCRK